MAIRLFNNDPFFRPFLVDRFFEDDDDDLFNVFRNSLIRPSTQLPPPPAGEGQGQVASTGENSNAVTTGFTSPNLTRELVPLMSTDLIESDKDFNIHVDLPGVEPSDLDISIIDKNLVITAERKQSHEVNNDKVHSMERSYGKVQRKIRIPNQADLDKAETNFKNGVLTITLPKKATPEGSVRKLDVKTA